MQSKVFWMLAAMLAAMVAPPIHALESHVIDSIGNVGLAPKVRLGQDGLPVIAYLQEITGTGERYLKVAKCADASCTAPPAVNLVLTSGSFSDYDFAIGADGRPLVLYRDLAGLRLLTCGDAACTANNTSQALTAPAMAGAARLAVGSNGKPVVAVAYQSGITGVPSQYPDHSLALITCSTSNCSSSSYKLVPGSDDVSVAGPRIALAPDGRPVLAYARREGGEGFGRYVRVIRCTDTLCNGAGALAEFESGLGRIDALELTVQANGTPAVAYSWQSVASGAAPQQVRIVRCLAVDCQTGASINVASLQGSPLEIHRAQDGTPLVIAASSVDIGGNRIVKCGDLACGSGSTNSPLGLASSSDMSAVIRNDGKLLIAFLDTAGFDLAVANCDTAACLGPQTIPSPGQGGEPLAVLTSIDGASISLFDSTTAEFVSSLPVGEGPEGVAITPDGQRAFITNVDDDSISYVDLAHRVVDRVVPVGPGGVAAPRGIAVSPDGKRLFVANSNQSTVAVVDVASGAITKTLAVGGGPFGLAINPQGTKLVVANQIAGTASIVDVAALAVVGTVNVGAQPFGVATSPDGATAYVASFGTDRVTLVDLATHLIRTSIQVGIGPFGVAPSPDGRKLYVSDNANQVSVVDLDAGATVASIDVGLHPQGLAVTLDGNYLYVANQFDDTVSIVDTRTRQVVRELVVADGPVSLGSFIAGPVFVEAHAVEFFHAGMGHYFMSADADEIAGLDQGVFAGWARTGETWYVWKQGGGLKDVCRFFTVTFAPKGSHFYTANPAECELVKHNPDWQYEKIAFKVYPRVHETCPVGIPLYRVYNQGMTGAPNHRYTTSAAIRDQMIASGYYDEGITGCVPR